MSTPHVTYADAGVDTEAGDKAVELMKDAVRATHGPQVLGGVGGFAGLYEVWEPPEGEALTTCTIITTEANELMKPIHDRMPVIVPKEKQDLWLDPGVKDQESLLDLLKPHPAVDLDAYPVSRRVNSPANNFPDCIKPASR